ncbi:MULTISPECIES: S-type pyocin domain-containing protein [unclassified Pseudomonas]|uniref:S-type pyocin domain-containing protein n=1 Tax=unclassified Pseudomonas TaxID=196821 RepID=UPI0011AC1B4E|nr:MULTISPECIES: S-type pyocin domain-containing protein [unclassified Pseudomonas]TWC25227.1 S-type pyocin [Pseudomonas sp. SJZ083]TWC51484.1 S-type pyocin [Pseudomonas sp. SJZ077]
MQKPPRPGSLDIRTPIHTIGVAPDHMTPAPLTSNIVTTGPHGHGIPVYYQNLNTIKATSQALEQEYQTKSSQLPQTIENELAATRLEGPTDPLPPAQSIIRELDVRNRLTARKTAEFHNKTAIAHSFYGGDPFNRHINEFMKKATTIEKRPTPDGAAMQALFQSLRAAHDARLLAQGLELLRQQNVNVQNFLSAVQANEQAQRAAAELLRVNEEAAIRAREQQRLAALENAQQVAAEQARLEAKAQAQAQEQARIAELNTALAEAEANAKAAAHHFAAEQARLQAEMEQQIEQIQRQLETERQRLETRLKVIDSATAVAQRHVQRVNLIVQQLKERQAQERERQQGRLTAEDETRRKLEQARLSGSEETEARWQSPTFANVGSTAAFGPAFTGTTGTIGNSPATSLALKTALRTAVSAVTATLATAAAPVLVGFAALFAPSRLGNGDLFSVSVPLSELSPVPTAHLYEQAVAGGTIDLPVTLGSKSIGHRVEIVVVTTDGVTVPASVPVNLAHFDAGKNVYVSGSTVANGPVITWTPLVEPINPSTDLPLSETDLPIYEGATVTPNTGRVNPFPELDRYGFGGFITVFPIDSGLPPIFTLLRDRRQDPGIASGAGQSVSGNWLGAAATLEGAPIPKQLADKLRGREFSSFDAFRRVFWRKVANDELLMDQFSFFNKIDIRRGLSPSALPSEQVGGRQKFEIHHIKPISEGGSVYDLDNLRVLTPKQHIKIHSKKGDK